jgi:predicted MPP superfamily phosphohydrolase
MFVSKYIIIPKIIYDIYAIPFYIFQTSILFIALYLLIGKIIKFPFISIKYLIERIKPFKKIIHNLKSNKSVVKFDESRRAFIRTSTFVVSGLAFTGSGLGVIRKDDFDIRYREIIIPNLPEELKGLKIVQINDFHSGPFMSFKQMNLYCKVVNSLNPDLILIPGDITNSLAPEVHPFIDAFKNLKSKYGVYITLGNHDYFGNPEYVADKITNDSPFKMLRNESDVLKINGKNLILLGMEDTQSSGAKFSPVVTKNLDETVTSASKKFASMGFNYEETPKILLYHKPYFFPLMLDKNIDLMLSGHTHGGQIVLAKIGDFNFSIAAATSPYISGLYKEKNSQMYISDGLGTVGLPLRLNCPPEITVLTLV